MTRTHARRRFALLVAAHLACIGALAAPGPALAMQISSTRRTMPSSPPRSPPTGVNRIALAGDMVAKVVRAPDGFAVEHDAVSGDLYLRPARARPGTHPTGSFGP